ncbi:hypothetical protein Hanom_Chr12g01146191 [Helianthus anomalus]
MTHYRRNHIPAFGSWDCNDDLPFTQCFESARQAGLIRYSGGDRDLYVAGDLYENNIVTPAIIVAPRRRGYPKKPKKEVWVEYDDCETKEPPSPVSVAAEQPSSPPAVRRVKPKPVDEDLYKISPELLREKPKRKKWGLFSSCVM